MIKLPKIDFLVRCLWWVLEQIAEIVVGVLLVHEIVSALSESVEEEEGSSSRQDCWGRRIIF
jgi:hypothetical protein